MAFPTDFAALRVALKGRNYKDIKKAVGEQIKHYKNNDRSSNLKGEEYFEYFFNTITREIGAKPLVNKNKSGDYFTEINRKFNNTKIGNNLCICVLHWFNTCANSKTYIDEIEKYLKKVENDTSSEPNEVQGGGDPFNEEVPKPPLPPPLPPSPPKGRTNAPRPIHNFVGRKTELKRIHVIFTGAAGAAAIAQSNMGNVTAAVQGLGGVGKSSLARQYADDYCKSYTCVWWCNAEKQTTFLPDLHKLAEFLDIDRGKLSDAQWAIEAVHGLSGRDDMHLLIYDNVENPQAIKDFMPGSYARLLITSRFHNWHAYAEVVELDVLPLKDAIAFLKKRAPSADAAGAELLAKTLGCLPLALDHAAAYCESGKVSFVEYATEAARRIAEDSPASDYPKSVKATFDMAIGKAVALCPEAETLITYMAYCAPDQIPDLLVEGAIADGDKRVRAIQALRQLSLIKDDPIMDRSSASDDKIHPEGYKSPETSRIPVSIPAWSVHRLVQEVARERSRPCLIATMKAIGQQLNRVFPLNGYDAVEPWPLCASLLPHVEKVFSFDAANSDAGDFSTVFDAAGVYVLGRLNREDAYRFLARALQIRERVASVSPRDYARTTSNMALYHHVAGNLKLARDMGEKVIIFEKENLSASDELIGTSLNNLAYVYTDMNQHQLAVSMFLEALIHTQGLYHSDHLEIATANDNLGLACLKAERLDDARRYCEEGLRIRTKQRDENHIDIAWSLDNLAAVKQAQGDLTGAYADFERAVAINVKFYGPEDSTPAQGMLGMAEILCRQKEFKRAREQFDQAFGLAQNVLPPEHYELGMFLERGAEIMLAAGDRDGAINSFQRAHAIYQQAYGEENPSTTACANRLAEVAQADS